MSNNCHFCEGSNPEWVTKGLNDLVRLAKDIHLGKTSSRFKYSHDDEVGKLGMAFNEMLDTIALKTEEKNELLINYKNAKKAAESFLDVKNSFLANISHELRTPLNSLLLLSEDLSLNNKGNLDSDQIKEIKVMHSESKNLLFLINDI